VTSAQNNRLGLSQLLIFVSQIAHHYFVVVRMIGWVASCLTLHYDTSLLNDADGSHVSIALIPHTIKPKQMKLKSPNSAQGWSITIPRPPMNIRSRSQGQKVATRQRAAPSSGRVTLLNETAPHGQHRGELCTLSSAHPASG